MLHIVIRTHEVSRARKGFGIKVHLINYVCIYKCYERNGMCRVKRIASTTEKANKTKGSGVREPCSGSILESLVMT